MLMDRVTTYSRNPKLTRQQIEYEILDQVAGFRSVIDLLEEDFGFEPTPKQIGALSLLEGVLEHPDNRTPSENIWRHRYFADDGTEEARGIRMMADVLLDVAEHFGAMAISSMEERNGTADDGGTRIAGADPV